MMWILMTPPLGNDGNDGNHDDDDDDYFGDDANLGVWASSSFMRASIPTWLSSPPPSPAARPASEDTIYDNEDEDD